MSEMASTTQFVFVSGMGRSGTTLVEKLVSAHPAVSILSQPFPLLFVETKREFLQSAGTGGTSNPLSHYFADDDYSIADLTRHLLSAAPAPSTVARAFEEMETFSGRMDRSVDPRQIQTELASSFPELYKNLVSQPPHQNTEFWLGSKEVHCEEFYPAFLKAGIRCLNVLRDPRDVIASFNCGRGHAYVGHSRPTLFYCRNWRKSVAFTIQLAQQMGFHWFRYRDAVTAPEKTFQEVFQWLEVAPLEDEIAGRPIPNQQGGVWEGNSSYEPRTTVSDRSVGTYRNLLSEPVIRFIEATCFPEMRWLEIPCSTDAPDDPERAIVGFEEPFPIERETFDQSYSSCEKHVDQELTRLTLLSEPALPDTGSKYFLSPDVHSVLREYR